MPTLNFYSLALEVLIYGEKVRDFLEHVRVDVGVVPDVGVARIVLTDRQDLFVERALVEHFEEANGPDFLHASREAGSGTSTRTSSGSPSSLSVEGMNP